jgi:hypothetical protein
VTNKKKERRTKCRKKGRQEEGWIVKEKEKGYHSEESDIVRSNHKTGGKEY